MGTFCRKIVIHVSFACLMIIVVLLAAELLENTVFSRKIYICADGLKNQNSEGNEIWIKGVFIDGREYPACDGLTIDGNWIKNEEYLLWRDYDLEQELSSEIAIHIPKGNNVKIVFQTNCWRGITTIRYKGIIEEIDTYSISQEYQESLEYSVDMSKFFSITLICDSFNLFFLIGILSIIGLYILINIYAKRDTVNRNKREAWMDILKILCAYMIVIIHISGDLYNINFNVKDSAYLSGLYINCITRFAVPCFIMISGTLMLSYCKDFFSIMKKIRNLIITLVFWSIIYLLARKILWEPNLDLVNEIITIPFSSKNGHMWYIYQLIWIYMFLPFIHILYYKTSEKQKLYFIFITLFIPSFLDYICKMFTNIEINFVPNTSIKLQIEYIGLIFLGRYLYEKMSNKCTGLIKYSSYIITYIGISMLIMSTWYLSYKKGYATDELFYELKLPSLLYGIGIYMIFLLFKEKINLINDTIKYAIYMVSDSLLGVYLGHCLLQWITNNIKHQSVGEIVLLALIQFAVCIFISCFFKKLYNIVKLQWRKK